MDIQQLEYDADVRIKFAAINQKGGLDGDANQEYLDLLSNFANGWTYTENPLPIETRFEWMRRSWTFTYKDKKTEIAAVEHETGIEILVAITSGLAVEAIVHFTKWAWNKWKASRAADTHKIESSLIVETVTDRTESGTIRTINKIEVHAPLAESDITKYIEAALKGAASKVVN